MLIASHLRRGLNRGPYEAERAQKLIKEKLPTHIPVWYQTILIQVIYVQHDRPRNHDKLRSSREAELHRSRCSVAYAPGLYRSVPPAPSPSPLPPTYPHPLPNTKKRAVKLWSVEPRKNQQVTDKMTQPHRNCETVKPNKLSKINHLHAAIPSLTETVKL